MLPNNLWWNLMYLNLLRILTVSEFSFKLIEVGLVFFVLIMWGMNFCCTSIIYFLFWFVIGNFVWNAFPNIDGGISCNSSDIEVDDLRADDNIDKKTLVMKRLRRKNWRSECERTRSCSRGSKKNRSLRHCKLKRRRWLSPPRIRYAGRRWHELKMAFWSTCWRSWKSATTVGLYVVLFQRRVSQLAVHPLL